MRFEMRFVGDCHIALLTFSVVILSIYFAISRIKLEISISSGNVTRVNISQKPLFDEDFMFMSISEDIDRSNSLHYDYYRDSCPSAEKLIAKSVRDIYDVRPRVAPSLIRLLFHDCFIEGCDASILLDLDEALTSEKEALPNLSLQGFDVIDEIKSELENVCPGVVSCADILVLAAREAVLLTGGPFYPLETGRKDSAVAFKVIAQNELPSPQANISMIHASFASRGFNERETVSLLGAHSIGIIHCTFLETRLYNFSGTGKPDPELDPGFLQELKVKCPFSSSALSPLACPDTGLLPSDSENDYVTSSGILTDGEIDLSYNNEGGDENFGTRYYKRLMEKKGLLFSDQQLMGSEETETWVKAYASDPSLFRRDFVTSMMKLSSYHVLTGPLGQVRTTCSKVLPKN